MQNDIIKLKDKLRASFHTWSHLIKHIMGCIGGPPWENSLATGRDYFFLLNWPINMFSMMSCPYGIMLSYCMWAKVKGIDNSFTFLGGLTTTINWLINQSNQSVKVQLVANYLYNWLIIKVIFPSKNVTHLLLKCEVCCCFLSFMTHT